MIATRSALRTAILAGTMLAAFPAFAQDASAVGERIKALFSEQGVELAYSGATASGDDITLAGASIKPAGESQPLPVGDIVLSDVEEDAGRLTIGSMALDTFKQTQDGLDVSVEGVTISGLVIPPAGALDETVAYDDAEIGGIAVSRGGTQLFSLSDFSVEVTKPEGGSPFGFTGGAKRFAIDLGQVTDPNARQFIDGLGYRNLEGSLEMAGSWNPADGRTVLSKNDIILDDAGTIGLTLDVSGYTPALQRSLNEVQQKMAASGPNDSAAGMAMLGLMQQLTLNTASLRFTDNSLTGKVLEYFAKMQGAKPSDIANQTKALLPFALAQLNNPDFARQISEATSRFLDDPKSLTISMKPAQPLPFAAVAAGAMTAPTGLPQQLGVTVTAND